MSEKNCLRLVGTLAILCLAGCGGSGSSNPTPSNIYSCLGTGSQYICVPVSGGRPAEPEPSAKPFPVSTSVATLIGSGVTASGLYATPYTPGTFTITKTPSVTTFNGVTVTDLRTQTNWTTGGYPSPYSVYFDSTNQVLGFSLGGLYGLRTSGVAFPSQANDGATGTLASYNLYSDSALSIQVGSASLTYSITNCCDLWSKNKADFLLTLSLRDSSNSVIGVLKQKFVITTSGGIGFGYDSFYDNVTTRELYSVYGGY